MKEILRVTAVSYLNTKPLLFGLVMNNLENSISISLEDPASCAEKLRNDETDIALIPVAAIPTIKNAKIVSDYCIGAIKEVQSVCIFSQVPLEQIERLVLDPESRTSVMLAYVLMREYWHINPKLIKSNQELGQNIIGTTAAVVIGDKAMALLGKCKYVYDLSEAWFNHTQLPFVFAAWVTTKELNPQFLEQFNKALGTGISQIPSLLYLMPKPESHIDLLSYFTKNISYHLDKAKLQGLDLFFEKIKMYGADFEKASNAHFITS